MGYVMSHILSALSHVVCDTHQWTRLDFVLNFTSDLLEIRENPFGKSLEQEKGDWREDVVSLSFFFVLFAFQNIFFLNLN
jgi:hypothetical protein